MIASIFLLLAGTPNLALAGQFELTMDCLNGGPNNLFTPSNSDPISLTTTATCPTDGGRSGGLHVGMVQGSPNPYIADSAHADYTFTTIPNTTITALSYRRYLGQFGGDADTIPALRDDTGSVILGEWCQYPVGEDSCERGSELTSVEPTLISGLSTSSLSFGLRCVAKPPAPVCGSSGPLFEHAWFSVYSAVLTISETTVPTLGATSGGLTTAGWLRGAQTLVLASSTDTTGIETADVTIDGGSPIAPSSGAPAICDFTRPKPCSNLSGTSWSIDTDALPDGQHTTVVTVTDPAGNSANAQVAFSSDNTAPSAPTVSSTVGESWQEAPSTHLGWTVPDQGAGAPVNGAFWSLCDAGGQNCSAATSTDSLSSTDVTVPHEGSYVIRLWLVDAAGNGDISHAAAIPMRYAVTPPPAPSAITTSASDWQASPAVTVAWIPPTRTGSEPPLVAGRVQLCNADGAECGSPQPVAATGGILTLPRQGIFVVRGMVLDAAGHVSPAVTALARFSATRPTLQILSRTPTGSSTSPSFSIAFAAQPGGPAPLAFTRWSLCIREQCARSGTTIGAGLQGAVPGPGGWTLTLVPVDAAGNEGSAVQTGFTYRPTPNLRVGVRRLHRELHIGIAASADFSGRVRAQAVVRNGRSLRSYRRAPMVHHGRGGAVLRVASTARLVRLVVRFDGSATFSRQRVVVVPHQAR